MREMAEQGETEQTHHTDPSILYDDIQSVSYATENNEHRTLPTFEQQEPTAPPLPMNRQRPQMYGTMISPKTYDGKTNPKIWLNHYELVADANLWNDDLKLRRVIGVLVGVAQNWYMNLRLTNQITDGKTLKDCLISRF